MLYEVITVRLAVCVIRFRKLFKAQQVVFNPFFVWLSVCNTVFDFFIGNNTALLKVSNEDTTWLQTTTEFNVFRCNVNNTRL